MRYTAARLFLLYSYLASKSQLFSYGQEVCVEWTQLGGDLLGEAYYDFSGASVSISSDGKTVAIGAKNNNDDGNGNGIISGHVRVYSYGEDEDAWTQVGTDIEGKIYDRLGNDVELSADGMTLAIGAPGRDYYRGYARLLKFNTDSDDWEDFGDLINGLNAGDSAGDEVALSTDGEVVAVGSTRAGPDDYYTGHVRVFVNDNNSWVQRGQTIEGENAENSDYSGKGLALSADGNILAIGALNNNGSPGETYYVGHVRVYEYSEENQVWTQLGNDLDGDSSCNYYGENLDLSADGYTILIGADNGSYEKDQEYYYTGYVRVFSYSKDSGSWTKLGQRINGEGDGDEFGSSASISASGKTIAVGAEYAKETADTEDYLGHVRIFDYDSVTDAWIQYGDDLDGEVNYGMGQDVALSDDGNIVAIGADSASNYKGLVQVMQRNTCSSPTVTPSASTGSPTGSPTASPIATPKAVCKDSQKFRFNKDKKKSCIWIGSQEKRRKNRCKNSDVRNNCKITCGTCCADDLTRNFQTGPKGNKQKRDCSYLFAQKRRVNLCPRRDVNAKCAQTCGRCCKNTPGYTFNVGNTTRDCKWLTLEKSRNKKLCQTTSISGNCSAACKSCKDYTVRESSPIKAPVKAPMTAPVAPPPADDD